ncbi:nana plant2 [Zea mays]|uniref:Nana plant2 n=1 Tax=Zea mays TaxID=4577 RepID=A0A1D6GX77_MAIZE|nr:nana plant2 [Zea mays]
MWSAMKSEKKRQKQHDGRGRVLRPRGGAEGGGVQRRGGCAQAGAVADREPQLPAAVRGVGAEREGLLAHVRRVALRALPPKVRGGGHVHERVLQVQEGAQDGEGGAGGGGGHTGAGLRGRGGLKARGRFA